MKFDKDKFLNLLKGSKNIGTRSFGALVMRNVIKPLDEDEGDDFINPMQLIGWMNSEISVDHETLIKMFDDKSIYLGTRLIGKKCCAFIKDCLIQSGVGEDEFLKPITPKKISFFQCPKCKCHLVAAEYIQ